MAGPGSTTTVEGGGRGVLRPPRPLAEIASAATRLEGHPVVRAALDLAHGPVLVLNRELQIVLASPGLAALLPAGTVVAAAARPGETLHCAHATAGCAEAAKCAGCGVLRAVAEALGSGEAAGCGCSLPVLRGGTTDVLELRVRASPLVVDGEPYALVSLLDAGAAETRDALDRVFLHDLSDSLSALLVWAHLLEARPADSARAAHQMGAVARRVAGEVQEQRVLLQAQTGRLTVQAGSAQARELLEAARAQAEAHPAANGRSLEAQLVGPEFGVTTDASLLQRVLSLLLRNALEATPRGGSVGLTAELRGEHCEWRVREPGTVALDALAPEGDAGNPARVRHLRLRSARLLVEKYLGGEIACSSAAGEGTTFLVRLPA